MSAARRPALADQLSTRPSGIQPHPRHVHVAVSTSAAPFDALDLKRRMRTGRSSSRPATSSDSHQRHRRPATTAEGQGYTSSSKRSHTSDSTTQYAERRLQHRMQISMGSTDASSVGDFGTCAGLVDDEELERLLLAFAVLDRLALKEGVVGVARDELVGAVFSDRLTATAGFESDHASAPIAGGRVDNVARAVVPMEEKADATKVPLSLVRRLPYRTLAKRLEAKLRTLQEELDQVRQQLKRTLEQSGSQVSSVQLEVERREGRARQLAAEMKSLRQEMAQASQEHRRLQRESDKAAQKAQQSIAKLERTVQDKDEHLTSVTQQLHVAKQHEARLVKLPNELSTRHVLASVASSVKAANAGAVLRAGSQAANANVRQASALLGRVLVQHETRLGTVAQAVIKHAVTMTTTTAELGPDMVSVFMSPLRKLDIPTARTSVASTVEELRQCIMRDLRFSLRCKENKQLLAGKDNQAYQAKDQFYASQMPIDADATESAAVDETLWQQFVPSLGRELPAVSGEAAGIVAFIVGIRQFAWLSGLRTRLSVDVAADVSEDIANFTALEGLVTDVAVELYDSSQTCAGLTLERLRCAGNKMASDNQSRELCDVFDSFRDIILAALAGHRLSVVIALACILNLIVYKAMLKTEDDYKQFLRELRCADDVDNDLLNFCGSLEKRYSTDRFAALICQQLLLNKLPFARVTGSHLRDHDALPAQPVKVTVLEAALQARNPGLPVKLVRAALANMSEGDDGMALSFHEAVDAHMLIELLWRFDAVVGNLHDFTAGVSESQRLRNKKRRDAGLVTAAVS